MTLCDGTTFLGCLWKNLPKNRKGYTEVAVGQTFILVVSSIDNTLLYACRIQSFHHQPRIIHPGTECKPTLDYKSIPISIPELLFENVDHCYPHSYCPLIVKSISTYRGANQSYCPYQPHQSFTLQDCCMYIIYYLTWMWISCSVRRNFKLSHKIQPLDLLLAMQWPCQAVFICCPFAYWCFMFFINIITILALFYSCVYYCLWKLREMRGMT